MDADELSDTNKDEYYWFQLIDISVYTKGDEYVGKVIKLLGSTGQSILVLQGVDDREILIPFVGDIVREIDLKNKKIIIQPPDGLLEIN